MQPRSAPSCRSVTNVAPGAASASCARDRAFGHAELGADRAAREREQRGAEVSVGAHRSVNAKDA